MMRLRMAVLGTIMTAGLATAAMVQQNFDAVEIQALPVADGIYMLTGSGGNMAVSAGDDGVVLIDDQYAPLTDKIRKAVAAISAEPIRFVLNTHWHADHTGGNENLGKAGALLVAHDNVRQRMSVEQFMEAFDRRVPPSPAGALPVVTFNDAVTFHLNGDEIGVFHVASAHTDGDAIVWFRTSGVVHMGDTFFNGGYPFIDLSSGGSVDGMIAACTRVLDLTDGDAKIMPGHGPLADRAALQRYRDMLVTIRDRVRPMVDAGRSFDEVVAANPSREFDEAWGSGFVNPHDFLSFVYQSLKTG